MQVSDRLPKLSMSQWKGLALACERIDTIAAAIATLETPFRPVLLHQLSEVKALLAGMYNKGEACLIRARADRKIAPKQYATRPRVFPVDENGNSTRWKKEA